MKKYIISRILLMFVLLAMVSVFSFIVIQLPPGDFVTRYVALLEREMGQALGPEFQIALRQQLGFDKSKTEQYFFWMRNFLRGDMGRSMEYRVSVNSLIRDRLPITVVLSVITMGFTYLFAIPIGIFSARKQYSIGDYIFTFLAFIGIATPSFFLALVLMYFFSRYFGLSVGGINSIEFLGAPPSFAKFVDTLKHLPLPIFVIMLQGMAGIVRVMRGQVLDEIKRPYVVAARARGLEENSLIYRYPVRVAMNPIISSMGNMLAAVVSGMTITAIVMNVPSIGLLLFNSLLAQDMYLAASCIMILSTMTVIGMFISDILLAVMDPRIRLD